MAIKRSNLTEVQIALMRRQTHKGTTASEVRRKAGITEATLSNWRKEYAGLMPSETKRLHQLLEENGRLRKIVADLLLDTAMLQRTIRRNYGPLRPCKVLG